MVITFSGLDGSGKTTLAEALADYLKRNGHSVRYIHAIKDSFHYFLLHKCIGRVSGSSQASLEKGLRDKDKKIQVSLLLNIKKIFLLLQSVYFALRYGNRKGKRKLHVICDRYFYDEIVQLSYLGSKEGIFLALLKAFIIKPDLAFLLEVKPMLAYERKKEYKEEYFETKSNLYREVLKPFQSIRVPEGKLPDCLQYILGEVERIM